MTDLEQIFRCYDGEENRFNRNERNYKRDLYDLVEYIKHITYETSLLSERIRKSEAFLSNLRKSGEKNIDTILATMYQLRQ